MLTNSCVGEQRFPVADFTSVVRQSNIFIRHKLLSFLIVRPKKYFLKSLTDMRYRLEMKIEGESLRFMSICFAEK